MPFSIELKFLRNIASFKLHILKVFYYNHFLDNIEFHSNVDPYNSYNFCKAINCFYCVNPSSIITNEKLFYTHRTKEYLPIY